MFPALNSLSFWLFHCNYLVTLHVPGVTNERANKQGIPLLLNQAPTRDYFDLHFIKTPKHKRCWSCYGFWLICTQNLSPFLSFKNSFTPIPDHTCHTCVPNWSRVQYIPGPSRTLNVPPPRFHYLQILRNQSCMIDYNIFLHRILNYYVNPNQQARESSYTDKSL